MNSESSDPLMSNCEPPPWVQRRAALLDLHHTTAFRLFHGAADGQAGLYADVLGDFLMSQSETPAGPKERSFIESLTTANGRRLELRGLPRVIIRGVYHKTLSRHVRTASPAETGARCIHGAPAQGPVVVRENGVRYEMSFDEGYSTGLFLDQRENRRRLLTGSIAPGFDLYPSRPPAGFAVLNTFAYTCGFSLCAAMSGAATTSVDLSRKYLEWGHRNFALNGLRAEDHEFITGDVFEWLRRLHRKERRFDLVILDPPTFSASKKTGVFRAAADYGKLVGAALPLLKPDGVLFASTNAAKFPPDPFMRTIQTAVTGASRSILQSHFVPQPLDFPVHKLEPAYLKTAWFRISAAAARHG